MALTQHDMDRKIDEHFGFEARDDVEGVLSTLARDVVHDIVGWPTGPTVGREGARPFYETLFSDLSDGKVTCIKRLYGDNFLIDESVWRGNAPGRPFGLQGGNRPLVLRLLHVLEFTRGGYLRKGAGMVGPAALREQQPQS